MTTSDPLAATLAVLSAMGIDPRDMAQALLDHAADEPTRASNVPTVAEYLAIVEANTSAKGIRTYRSYWRRLVDDLGHKRLDEVRASDIGAFAKKCQANAVVRSNSTGGTGAHGNAITTARAFFGLAYSDGLIAENPAEKIRKARRNPRPRRALEASELVDLEQISRTTGNDPKLDALLMRFHLETAARRGGAIALTVGDLDDRRQTVMLLEKGDKRREVPVTANLLAHLHQHAKTRTVGPVGPGTPVFHFGNGTPLTRRRYNYLAERWQKHLPWAKAVGVSIHWLRHTVLTDTERLAGEAVATALAGHTPGSVTAGYTTATIAEVARALVLRTGSDHPLAGG